MGGRGASSGFSYDKNGNPKNKYGTQYHTVYQDGNIKFVQKNRRDSEALMETMTQGRIYGVIASGQVDTIILFDENNKRNRTIHLRDPHAQPHSHKGYFHDEYDKDTSLSDSDKEIIAKVLKAWQNKK